MKRMPFWKCLKGSKVKGVSPSVREDIDNDGKGYEPANLIISAPQHQQVIDECGEETIGTIQETLSETKNAYAKASPYHLYLPENPEIAYTPRPAKLRARRSQPAVYTTLGLEGKSYVGELVHPVDAMDGVNSQPIQAMNLNQHSSAQDVDLDWFHRERPTTGYLNNLYMPIVNADEGSQGNSEVFVDCRNGIANPTLTPDVASKKIAKPMPRHPKDESLNHELVVDRILHSALPGLPDAEASKQQMVQVDTAKDKESKEAIQHQNLTTLFRDNGLAVNYVYMPLLEPSHGSTGPLVNGYNPAKRSSLSLEDHSLPSGIPSTAEFVEINHLIAQGLPDQIPSLEEQLKLSQGTIATQAKLIRKLHANIDKARAHMNMVTKKQVLAWAKEMDLQKERIELLEESIAIIEDNNTNLKIAVDFGVKILGCCFHREWALWQFSDRLENKSRGRSRSLLRNLCNFNTKAKKVKDANLQAGKYPHGYQWDIFGRGPEPSNSTGVPRGIRDALGIDHEQSQLRAIHLTNGSISKNDSAFPNAEKKALARMARLNMDLMNNDCEEWLTLVRGCRNRPTGIEDVYDDFTS